MNFRKRMKYMREFRSIFRDVRKENPNLNWYECRDEALCRMHDRYGDSPDWQTIIEMILNFLMELLPFFFEDNKHA